MSSVENFLKQLQNYRSVKSENLWWNHCTLGLIRWVRSTPKNDLNEGLEIVLHQLLPNGHQWPICGSIWCVYLLGTYLVFLWATWHHCTVVKMANNRPKNCPTSRRHSSQSTVSRNPKFVFIIAIHVFSYHTKFGWRQFSGFWVIALLNWCIFGRNLIFFDKTCGNW